MGRRERDEGGELARIYEGQEVLGELLALAGSPAEVEQVKALFAAAQADGHPPSAIFPELFEEEPRFPSPELARRLYGNLFGLWDRIAAGKRDEPQQREAPPQPPPPEPPPEPIAEAVIPDAFIDRAFRALTTLPAKERRVERDRFEQKESDLVEAIRLLQLSPASEETAIDLAFELWTLCRWALGPRLGRTDFRALRQPSAKGAQPALERFLSEWLAEAELDEEEPLPAEERARIEPLLRAAAEQLAPVAG